MINTKPQASKFIWDIEKQIKKAQSMCGTSIWTMYKVADNLSSNCYSAFDIIIWQSSENEMPAALAAIGKELIFLKSILQFSSRM